MWDFLLQRVAQRLQLGHRRSINAAHDRSLFGNHGQFVQMGILVMHHHLARKTIGAHAVNTSAKGGILNTRIAGNHNALQLALAVLARHLFNDMIS